MNIKLKKRVKDKWLKALRSGEYQQGRGYLASRKVDEEDFSYCCLGVLCDLAVKEGVIPAPRGVHTDSAVDLKYGRGDSYFFLPEEVVEWATRKKSRDAHGEKFASRSDTLGDWLDEDDRSRTLVDLNDGGMTFAEIADVIEERF